MNPPDGFYPTDRAVAVVVTQPMPSGTARTFTATLLGGMLDRGMLLHYRVRDMDGVIWFVPPHWTPPPVDLAAWEAGISLVEMRQGAWIEHIQAAQRASQRPGWPGWPVTLFPPGQNPMHQPPRKPSRKETGA